MKIINTPKYILKENSWMTEYYESENSELKSKLFSTQELFEHYLTIRDTNNIYEEERYKCYCGHTQFCSCGDPNFGMFEQHLKTGYVSFNDNNGWTGSNTN